MKISTNIQYLLIIVVCIIVTTYLVDVIATGVRDIKAKATLGLLFDASNEINVYHKKFGLYPDHYNLPPDIVRKNGIQKYFYKRVGDSYELTVVITGIIVKDIRVKANPDGVYIESKTKDEWRRWFAPPAH